MIIIIVLLATTIFAPINSVDVEFYLDTIELINYWGYPSETHRVTTRDGFILQLHRIPKVGGPPVLLQHCMLCSSFDWVANPPRESAAFVLSDAGFDVWMGNFRGNRHSRQHIAWAPRDRQFWAWSWDEMAEHDLDAMVRGILDVTGRTTLDYIGHSLGTLTMFAKLSTDPRFAEKIGRFVALAPVATVTHTRGAFSFFGRHFGSDYQQYIDKYGPDEFFGNTWLYTKVIKNTCGIFEALQELCSDVVSLFVGPIDDHWNQTRLPVYLAHTPAGTSSNVIAHINQMFAYGGIPHFDMGPEKNLRVYGSTIPPQYDFSKIRNVSIYLFWSEDDFLSTKKDIEERILVDLHESVLKGSYKLEHYNHLHFLWGTQAANDIYKPIIDLLKK